MRGCTIYMKWNWNGIDGQDDRQLLSNLYLPTRYILTQKIEKENGWIYTFQFPIDDDKIAFKRNFHIRTWQI